MSLTRAICVVLLLGVVLGRPQAPKSPVHFMPAADPHDSLRYRYETEVPHTQSADGAGTTLKYDVRLHPNAVALSEIKSIESIACSENSLELEVASEFFTTTNFAQWTDGHLLNGGSEWGCTDATGQPSTIMRRLASTHVVDGSHVILRTKGNVAVEEFFQDANIAFFSKRGERPAGFDQNVNSNKANRRVNRDGSITETQSVHITHVDGQTPVRLSQPTAPPTLGARFEVESGSKFVRVTSPAYRAAFKADDTITLTWDYGGWSDDMSVKIILKQERDIVWDTDMATVGQFPMSQGSTGVTLNVNAAWRNSRRYYMLMRWNCGWFKCDSATSPFFQIPLLQVLNPNGDSQFQPGDTIPVQWQSFSPLSADTKLKMTVYKDKPLWIDPKLVDTQTVVNTGAFDVVIPMETERGLYPYYVQFEWNCLIFGQFCDYSYSDRFTLPGQATDNWNYDPNSGRAIAEYPMISLSCANVQMACASIPNTPTDGATGVNGAGDGQMPVGRRLLADTKEAKLGPSPMTLDEMFGPNSLNHKLHRNDDKKYTKPVNVRPAYPDGSSFSGQAYTGKEHQQSPAALVTYASLSRGIPRGMTRHSSLGDEYSSNNGVWGVLDTDPPPCGATGADTGPLIGGPTGILKEICKLCQNGRSIEVSMTCSNCWVRFDYTVTKFEFIRNGAKIESLIANLEGNAQLNIELMFKAQYQQTLQSDPRDLFRVPMKTQSFSIAGIKIDLSVEFSLTWDYLIEYQLTGKLFWEGGINAQFSGNLRYGTQYPDSRLDTGHSFSYETYKNRPRITVDSSLHSRVTMHAMLIFKFMNLLTITMTANPYVDFMSTFAYPPMPELTDAPVPTALIKFPTDCLSPHYIEYNLVAAMGSLNVLAELEFKLPVLDPFRKSYSRDYPLPYENVNLISGCWLAPQSVADTQVEVAEMVNVTTQSQQRQYEWQVQREVSEAVGIDQDRVNVGDITVDQANSKTTVNIGFSSTVDNGPSDNPDVTGAYDPAPQSFMVRNGLWTSPSSRRGSPLFRLPHATTASNAADFVAAAGSTGSDVPPVYYEDFDPTPDTVSADVYAQRLHAAVADPTNGIHRIGNVLRRAIDVNVRQSFNPAVGHTLALAQPPPTWYLHADAFFVGFATALAILGAFVGMVYGYKQYKGTHGGSSAYSASSGNRSFRPVRSDYEDETGTGSSSYRPLNH